MASISKSTALTKALAPYDNQKPKTTGPLPLNPANIAIVGKKGCGKSSLLKALLDKPESPYHKFFHLIFFISPTAQYDPKMKEIAEDVGDEQCYTNLNDETICDILEKIEDFNINKWKKKKKRGNPNFLVIYDDVIHQMGSKKNIKMMSCLATQNRHHRIWNVWCIQKYNTFFPTVCRANLDVVIYFKTGNQKELNAFIEEESENESILQKLYEFATEDDYSFLVVNKYGATPKYYKRFDPIQFNPKIK